MNRAFGGSEGGRRHCCRTNFLQRGISPSHPSIYPSAHPHSVRPFLLLPSSSCGAGGAPTRRPITRICEGKCSFSYSSESEERCGRGNNRSHAMQLCNCRVPANCPANQPQPDRRARRGGRDGVVIGTTELWKAAGWRWVRATTTYGWLWSVRPLSFPLSLTHFN